MKPTNRIKAENNHPHIVYYDDSCPLCQSFVNSLKKKDKEKILSIQPLKLSSFKNENSVIFIDNGEIYSKSKAIYKILLRLKSFIFLRILLKVFPIKLSNTIYDFIAKNRKKFLSTN